MIKEEIVKLLETALKKMRVNPVTTSLRSKHFHDHSLMNTHLSLGSHPELSGYGVKDIVVTVETPANSIHGDYSSNLALKLTKTLKKNPFLIAQEIVKFLPKSSLIEKVEVIKPGFINFWTAKNSLYDSLDNFVKGSFNFPNVNLGQNKKIMVEFAHPNTHKLFHIGHLRNISTGEAIVRILEATGNEIIRTNYQGDVGLHIAKCLWAIKRLIKEKGDKSILEKDLTKKIKLLGKAYSTGQLAYENSETDKQEIIEINRQIYDQKIKILDLWTMTRQWSLDYFNEIYKRVYSHFDRCYFESEMNRSVEISQNLLKQKILEKSQGAIIFNGKKYGVDTRVFINSLGFPTYEGKELALAEKEFVDFGELDKCIHVVTPEQTSFFKVTFKVEEIIDKVKYGNRQFHLAYEWVKLKKGKMSSRTGNIIEAEWLLDEIKKQIRKKFKNTPEVEEILAVASAKYSFLKNSTDKAIAFDINESISLEGNSAPYLIYTYVRTRSILGKNLINPEVTYPKQLSDEEKNILRLIYQYPQIVAKSATDLAPNVIANYLFELAQQFNSFYQKCPILKAPEDKKYLRLQITKAVGQIIKNGLYLLGIKTVEKM